DLPVGSYTGGVPGLAATKPQRGRKIDPDNPNVAGYASYLEGRHNDSLRSVGGGRKIYDYRYTYNGFAVELTEAQAEAMKSQLGVVNVIKDTLQTTSTSNTPAFLGLSASGGLWTQL